MFMIMMQSGKHNHAVNMNLCDVVSVIRAEVHSILIPVFECAIKWTEENQVVQRFHSKSAVVLWGLRYNGYYLMNSRNTLQPAYLVSQSRASIWCSICNKYPRFRTIYLSYASFYKYNTMKCTLICFTRLFKGRDKKHTTTTIKVVIPNPRPPHHHHYHYIC